MFLVLICFFFSSRRRHTRFSRDWSSDVCSSDLSSLIVEKGKQTKIKRKRRKKEGKASKQQQQQHKETTQTTKKQHKRSEERRVGKESRSKWSPEQKKKKRKINRTEKIKHRNKRH